MGGPPHICLGGAHYIAGWRPPRARALPWRPHACYDDRERLVQPNSSCEHRLLIKHKCPPKTGRGSEHHEDPQVKSKRATSCHAPIMQYDTSTGATHITTPQPVYRCLPRPLCPGLPSACCSRGSQLPRAARYSWTSLPLQGSWQASLPPPPKRRHPPLRLQSPSRNHYPRRV